MMTASTAVSWRACASSLSGLLLLATCVASCGSTTRGDAKSRVVIARQSQRPIGRPERIQRDDFALLRTRPEGLPAHIRPLVKAAAAAIDPALAQRIPVMIPGSHWLVPGVGHLCIVSEVPGIPGVGTVCGSTRDAIREGIASIFFVPFERGHAGAPSRLVVGVAPDDAREALVHTHGSVATVPVYDGVFVLRDSLRAPSDFIELRRIRGG